MCICISLVALSVSCVLLRIGSYVGGLFVLEEIEAKLVWWLFGVSFPLPPFGMGKLGLVTARVSICGVVSEDNEV